MCMSGSATSCEECLLIHPSCAWCAQEVQPTCSLTFMYTAQSPQRWNNDCWPPCVRTFQPFIIFELQQTLTWGFFRSILQDFGRGRGLTSRCDLIQNLQRRGCGAQFIEYPTSSISVLKNMPLSSTGSGLAQFDVVQIMPQKISLSLRPGESSAHLESGGNHYTCMREGTVERGKLSHK